MSQLVDWLMTALSGLPPALILVVTFALPAVEASIFVGLLVPGETAVIVAGVLAQVGVVPLWAVMVCAAAGAIVGDQVGFHVGRRYGTALVARLPRWMTHRDQHERVLSLVRRRGAFAVVLGRWTASLRALVPGVAGMSGMSRRTFTVANALGGALWAVVVALVGYVAGAGYRQVEHSLNLAGGLALVGIAVIVVGVELVRRHRRRHCRAQSAHPPTAAPTSQSPNEELSR